MEIYKVVFFNQIHGQITMRIMHDTANNLWAYNYSNSSRRWAGFQWDIQDTVRKIRANKQNYILSDDFTLTT